MTTVSRFLSDIPEGTFPALHVAAVSWESDRARFGRDRRTAASAGHSRLPEDSIVVSAIGVAVGREAHRNLARGISFRPAASTAR